MIARLRTVRVFAFIGFATVVAACVLESSRVASAQPVEVLHPFAGGTDGANPYVGLVQGNDGNLYGTTRGDGTGNVATVFMMTPDGTTTTLHVFTEPANPRALIQASDGNLYGTTYTGGTSGNGQVFRLAPDGTFTVLHAFEGRPEGASPWGGLVEATDGNFYGTTEGGGTFNNYGTVFKMTPAGTITTLHSFRGSPIDGQHPRGTLIQVADGTFYGTTGFGGAFGRGTIFGMTPDGTVTIVHAFSGIEGVQPFAGVIQASDGNLYGTTIGGGVTDDGTAFMMSLDGGTFVRLHTFANDGDSTAPIDGLIEASDGNFYGTTQGGRIPQSMGTVFQITPTGDFTTLYSFTGGADGGDPGCALVQATDGNFYGTTYRGGDGLLGVVFRFALP